MSKSGLFNSQPPACYSSHCSSCYTHTSIHTLAPAAHYDRIRAPYTNPCSPRGWQVCKWAWRVCRGERGGAVQHHRAMNHPGAVVDSGTAVLYHNQQVGARIPGEVPLSSFVLI